MKNISNNNSSTIHCELNVCKDFYINLDNLLKKFDFGDITLY